MSELKSEIVSQSSRGSDILRALAQGIWDANGNPDLEMLRLVQDPDLGKVIGRVFMKTLFSPLELRIKARINWRMPIMQHFEGCEIGSPISESEALHQILQALFEPAVMLGGQHQYQLLRINRQMQPLEAGLRLVNRKAKLAKTAELLEVSKWIIQYARSSFPTATAQIMALGSQWMESHPMIGIFPTAREFVLHSKYKPLKRGTYILTRV